jgi:hypothetical protein
VSLDDDEADERRERFDRYNAEHDRAVAFLTCTAAGRSLFFKAFPHYKPERSEHSWVGAERPLGAGFADVVGGVQIKAGGEPYEMRRLLACILEVKTGTVCAGEVLRQLRRYERALVKDHKDERVDSLIVLVLAHVKPLSVAARDLLTRESIQLIDLGSNADFAAYGRAEPTA